MSICYNNTLQVGLLDPVCFLLFLPDVAVNFLHTDLKKLTPFIAALKCLVAKEKGIAHTLRRHMW
jgi:hypothetical protein